MLSNCIGVNSEKAQELKVPYGRFWIAQAGALPENPGLANVSRSK